MKWTRIVTGILICISFTAAILGISFVSTNKMVVNERQEKTTDDYSIEGDYYYEDGRYQLALVSYQNALDIDASNERAKRGLAETYEMLEYNEEAEQAYGELVRMKPGDIDTWLSYISLMIQNKKLDEAKQTTEKLLETSDDKRLKSLYENMNISAPEFNIQSGAYDEYQLLRVSRNDSYSNVYYTMDGTEPTKDSAVFTGDIVISNTENHIVAKSIGYLGYESEPVKLDIIINVPAEVVYNPGEYYDNSFLANINNELNKSYNDPIYNYELAKIRTLCIVGYDVSIENRDYLFHENSYERYSSTYTDTGNFSLKRIGYLPFLKKLYIGFEDGLDINELSSLNNLEELSLLHCGISNVEALADLKSLKKLSLGWNDIEDITPLSGMTQLETLGLWNNDISDISPLSSLDQLRYFDITGNNVTDISSMSKMNKLRELWLKNNEIRDLSPLDNCKELQILYQEGNPVENYGTLAKKAGEMVRTDLGGEVR